MYVAGSAIAFWFIALAGGFYWTRRYVRALEANSAERERIAMLEARLAALEAGRSASLGVVERAEPLRELARPTPDPGSPRASRGR